MHVDRKAQIMNKLMQDPRFLKLMQNPKVMQAAMNAMQMRGKLQQQFDQRVQELAKSLNLATQAEVRELKRALSRLEQQQAATKSGADDKAQSNP